MKTSFFKQSRHDTWKPILCVLLSAILTLSFFPFKSRAAESASDDWYQAICDQVSALPEVNDGQSDISPEIIRSYTAETSQDGIALASDSTQKSAMTLLLALYDDVPALTVSSILVKGNKVQGDADDLVEAGTIGSTENDPYRHFAWNYESVQSNINTEYVRIVTINYEWGTILADDWDTKYIERYNYWYDTYRISILLGYMTVENVSNMATADANDYVCALRDSLITQCRSSQDKFFYLFANDAVMDFHNNYLGRSYAELFTYTTYEAYSVGKKGAGICLNVASATSRRYSTYSDTARWDPTY